LVSVHTPCWHLENWPKKKVILASYGADLSVGFGKRVRDTFTDKDNDELLKVKLAKDSRKAAIFNTEQGGGMASVGVGGPITGRGADLLLIDDYIKEVKEALSPAYREYIWNWFVTTAYTRLEPNGTCIIIATRWHTDDLIGRILANLEGWEYIEIPAIAEADDLIGRQTGEALFPERYPLEALLERQKTLGTVWFNALFQQKPMDESKKLASSTWLKEAQYLPTDIPLRFARIWDLAATEGGGDYTTGTKLAYAKTTGQVWVVDVIRDQMSSQQAEALVKKTAAEDGRHVKIAIEQEPGSAGKALVNHYTVTVLPGYSVTPVPVAGLKKVIRAQPMLAGAEAGLITLIKASWNKAFKEEFDAFPGGLNDDQVDTLAAGYTLLTGKKVFSATFGRRKKQDNSNSRQTRRNIATVGSRNATVRDKYGKIHPIYPGSGSVGIVKGATWGRR
jgi:predicted phage terminase large subunit-like protein